MAAVVPEDDGIILISCGTHSLPNYETFSANKDMEESPFTRWPEPSPSFSYCVWSKTNKSASDTMLELQQYVLKNMVLFQFSWKNHTCPFPSFSSQGGAGCGSLYYFRAQACLSAASISHSSVDNPENYTVYLQVRMADDNKDGIWGMCIYNSNLVSAKVAQFCLRDTIDQTIDRRAVFGYYAGNCRSPDLEDMTASEFEIMVTAYNVQLQLITSEVSTLFEGCCDPADRDKDRVVAKVKSAVFPKGYGGVDRAAALAIKNRKQATLTDYSAINVGAITKFMTPKFPKAYTVSNQAIMWEVTQEAWPALSRYLNESQKECLYPATQSLNNLHLLDARFFPSGLSSVDVNNLRKIEHVGEITSVALKALGPKKVAQFVVQSGVLSMQIHLEPSVWCNGENSTQKGVCTVEYAGQGEFYTSCRNSYQFAFAVNVETDKEINSITISPCKWKCV